MLCYGKEDTAMLKKVVLTLAGIAMLGIPTIASARDRDDYVYGRRDNREWRERQRKHERHEWREHERRERRYYNNGYYNSPSYRTGYYDAYGNWHPYGW
jgi:Ni/Co efflux regulator RcnB